MDLTPRGSLREIRFLSAPPVEIFRQTFHHQFAVWVFSLLKNGKIDFLNDKKSD